MKALQDEPQDGEPGEAEAEGERPDQRERHGPEPAHQRDLRAGRVVSISFFGIRRTPNDRAQ